MYVKGNTKWKVVERVNREGFFFVKETTSILVEGNLALVWCVGETLVVRCRWGGNILKGCESVAGRV